MQITQIKLSKKQKRELRRILIAAGLLVLGVIISNILPTNEDIGTVGYFLKLACYLPAFIVAGGKTVVSAVSNITRGQFFDENLLMSIASICAYILGECSEGVFVMLFAAVGELFESYAVGNARGAISHLATLCPDSVNVEVDGKLVKKDSESVGVGEIFVVGSGERVALDGVVVEGFASLDCSSMTGESMPVSVGVGEHVSSGVMNLDGMIKIRAEKLASESGAARTLAMVEEAASKKSKTEAFITKFAMWYTPCVVGAAVITAILPPVLGFGEFSTWIYRAMTFLVISCPCALVISVPLTFFGSVGGAAKRGILFKDNSKIELLSKIEVVAFDKTGTLTCGKPAVVDAVCEDFDRDKFLEYAVAAEYSSTHPLSKAISEYGGQNFDSSLVGELSEVRGKGRVAIYDSHTVLLGNEALLSQYGVNIPSIAGNDGKTVVYMAVDGKYIGYFAISDMPRKDSAQTVKALENIGVHTVMLTGDSELASKEIAREIGISEYHASLLPGDKLSILENKLESSKCAFVGDGINDTPSLARADIGFAMGGAGSDSALEAGDVVIVGDRISAVFEAISVAKKTMRISWQNIIFALSVKTLVMILSAFGMANMWMAVFADVGVSVIAIINSMRTLK